MYHCARYRDGLLHSIDKQAKADGPECGEGSINYCADGWTMAAEPVPNAHSEQAGNRG